MKCPHCNSENVGKMASPIALGMLMIILSIWTLVIPVIGLIIFPLCVITGIVFILRGLQMKASNNAKHKNNMFCKTCNKRFFWNGAEAINLKQSLR
jgi:uncharacterized membrane protein HdeD (DUF308 family)